MPNTKFPYPKRDTLRITLVYLEDILGMSGGYVWTSWAYLENAPCQQLNLFFSYCSNLSIQSEVLCCFLFFSLTFGGSKTTRKYTCMVKIKMMIVLIFHPTYSWGQSAQWKERSICI